MMKEKSRDYRKQQFRDLETIGREAGPTMAIFSLLVVCFLLSSFTTRAQELGPAISDDVNYKVFDQEGRFNFEAVHKLLRRSGLNGASELVQNGYGDNEETDDTNSDEPDQDQEPTSISSWSSISPLAVGSVPSGHEVYLLEDKDYPKSLFEDYPRRVGQVSGIATLPNNDVVIFHRGEHQWNEETFNKSTKQVAQDKRDSLIKNDTIMILDREDGSSVASFGSNLFHMPHSVASDNLGNLWVSDVARHQVMRLPATNIRAIMERTKMNSSQASSRHQIWPDIILGEAFVPGLDQAHFCQPAEIAVSSNGQLVFVADGYCNQRVMVFAGATGKFLKSFGQLDNMRVVHSLALIEERNLLCVADREGARVLCYNAGLDGDLSSLGELVNQITHPLGRVFAITSISKNHLLVSSNQVDTNRYDLSILNPFTSELKLVWISSDLLEPHSLATTRDRESVYAADVSKEAYKKVFKFDIIQESEV